MTLVYISVAFVVGVVLGSRVNLPVWSMAVALLPLLMLFVRTASRKAIIIVALLLLALTGGAVRYQSAVPVVDAAHVQYYNDGVVNLGGVIATAPDVRDTATQITLEVRHIIVGAETRPVSGKVLVFVPRYPGYKYGDELRMTGKLETPARFDTFDYRNYLADRGIYSTMTYPQITAVSRGAGLAPLAWIYSLRDALAQKMAQVLPEPQASLAQGIILGVRAGIPPDVNEDFQRTGTTHILAISGQNLSIVAGMLVAAGIFIFGKRRYLYAWLAIAAIWVYTMLTGMSAPVVRSAIMVSIFLLAEILGRQKSALPALALAAAVMTAITPRLPWDASFQLSFLATFGLVQVAPIIESMAGKRQTPDNFLNRAINWVVGNFTVTVGVIIVIWPLMAYYFGTVSLVSPFATLLLVPALAPIVVSGGLAAVLALVALPLGQATGWVAWLFLSYMLAVIRGGAALPAVSMKVGVISPAALWTYYGVLAAALLAYAWRQRLRRILDVTADYLSGPVKRWAVPCLTVTAILSISFAATLPDNRTHVSFLDVGQGDAILIQNGAMDILIDGGPGSSRIALDLSRRMPFWDRTIELVVSTHPHADHLIGLIEALKRYRVQTVLFDETGSTSPLWAEWLALVRQKGVKTVIAHTGQVIDTGIPGVKIDVLSSFASAGEAIDPGGIVVRVTAGKVSFLLTADITEQTEMELLEQRSPVNATVLKVAHHGSSTGTSAAFLAVARPSVAVISVGAGNDYGHPNKDTLERLGAVVPETDIFRTDQDGTIEFTTDGERLWVRKER